MHIPSHTLKPEIAVATAALSIPFLAYALTQARRSPQLREKLPLLGASAAAILGLQAINLPIPGGTSGHLLGGAMLAIAFGPWLGSLAMAAVFFVQALVLGDGGLDALGANWLNGAIIGPMLGWAAYRAFANGEVSHVRRAGAAFSAGAVSLVAGAALCSLELSLSGHGSFSAVAGHMLEGSAFWAGLEGGLSALVVLALAASPSLLRKNSYASAALIGLAAFALIAKPVISSSQPDVLEKTLASSSQASR